MYSPTLAWMASTPGHAEYKHMAEHRRGDRGSRRNGLVALTVWTVALIGTAAAFASKGTPLA